MIDGIDRPDRTGVGTRALFGLQLEFENSLRSFPAVTTKKLALRQVCAELACFIQGFESLEDFHAYGCTIWDGNARQTSGSKFAPDYAGHLGRIYGKQWRDWQSVAHNEADTLRCEYTDQLANLAEGLRSNPNSRRHIVLAYNPGELDQVCLPACHVLFQCFVANGSLDLRVDMRSVDLFLGLPFDIASYAVLQRLLALATGLRSNRLIFQLGDAHIYYNHFEEVQEALRRAPRVPPQLLLREGCNWQTFVAEDAALINYHPYAAIPAPLNV